MAGLRDHVDEVREQRERADGADLVAADLVGELADGRGDARRDVAGIVAQCASAWCRRGSTGRATVISCQEMPCTPVDRADRDALGFEHRALLDVQFDEGVRERARGTGAGPA